MSDSDDSASDIPSREVCEERCQGFAAVTGTDTALAMYYLQDRRWDLQVAVNAYFEDNPQSRISWDSPMKQSQPSGTTSSNLPQLTSSQSSTPNSQPAVPLSASANNRQPTPLSTSANNRQPNPLSTSTSMTNTQLPSPQQEDPEPRRLRLITWNIDGLDDCNLVTRTKAVCKVIQQEKPDVVYLQEVVPKSQELLEEGCPLYQLIPSNNQSYYTVIMLRCDTTRYTEHHILPFYTSKMDRTVLQVKAHVKEVEFLLMSSHLESTKPHASERKRQLQKALKEMGGASDQQTVVFGGDLNLRDNELAEIGGLPDGILDLWEVTGKRPDAKFTWDLQRNDNLQMPCKFQPRARFDRLYLRHPKQQNNTVKPAVKPVYFELVGIERIPECQRFASDHWGLLVHFDKT